MRLNHKYARRSLALGALAVGGIVALAARPGHPRLEWYSSPPFSVGGKTLRIQMLSPAGWHAAFQPAPVGPYITIRPQDRLSWMPMGIRRLLHLEGEFNPSILACPSTGGDGKVHTWTGRHIPRFGGRRYYGAVRDLTGTGGFSIIYERDDRDEFEATYRQVCGSFRVVRL